jgi:hypothetical protein
VTKTTKQLERQQERLLEAYIGDVSYRVGVQTERAYFTARSSSETGTAITGHGHSTHHHMLLVLHQRNVRQLGAKNSGKIFRGGYIWQQFYLFGS